MSIFSFFLFSFTFYSLYTFIQIPAYYLSAALFVIFFFSSLVIYWLNEVVVNKSIYATVVGSLLASELFFVMSFWPVSYYVVGIVAALFFFIFCGIFRLQFTGVLNRRLARNFVVIVVLGLMATLLSARWF